MPHLIVEYSANLSDEVAKAHLVEMLHHAVGQCGLFKMGDVKTRAYEASDFLVGENGRDGSFLHLSMYIKEGRSAEQRGTLSDTLLEMLKAHLPSAQQLTVDIRELSDAAYRKFVR